MDGGDDGSRGEWVGGSGGWGPRARRHRQPWLLLVLAVVCRASVAGVDGRMMDDAVW